MSVMTLKLAGEQRTNVQALEALANSLGPLLRETDCAAVVETGTIALSMPLTTYRGGVQLANRIAEAVSNDANFAHQTLCWRVVEKRAFQTARALLESALTGPFMRVEAA